MSTCPLWSNDDSSAVSLAMKGKCLTSQWLNGEMTAWVTIDNWCLNLQVKSKFWCNQLKSLRYVSPAQAGTVFIIHFFDKNHNFIYIMCYTCMYVYILCVYLFCINCYCHHLYILFLTLVFIKFSVFEKHCIMNTGATGLKFANTQKYKMVWKNSTRNIFQLLNKSKYKDVRLVIVDIHCISRKTIIRW